MKYRSRIKFTCLAIALPNMTPIAPCTTSQIPKVFPYLANPNTRPQGNYKRHHARHEPLLTAVLLSPGEHGSITVSGVGQRLSPRYKTKRASINSINNYCSRILWVRGWWRPMTMRCGDAIGARVGACTVMP